MRLRSVTIEHGPVESSQYTPTKDVVQGLKCCRRYPLKDCKHCPYRDEDFCSTTLLKDTIEFIGKMTEANERLTILLSDTEKSFNKMTQLYNSAFNRYRNARVEITKEIAEKLKRHTRKMQSSDFNGDFWDKAVLVEDIDNLVKEVENENNA